MAARLLGAPVALISLVTDDRQFFKSATGLPEPWASRRDAPLPIRSAASRRSRRAARGRRRPARAAAPGQPGRPGAGLDRLRRGAARPRPGHVLGTLSVVDSVPRLWSERDVGLLQDLAASAATEIELRPPARRCESPSPRRPTADRARASCSRGRDPARRVSEDGRWIRVNRALCEFLGYAESDLLGAAADGTTHPEDRAADQEALRLLLAGSARATAERNAAGGGRERSPGC